MKLSDLEIVELNKLIKRKFDLPSNKREVSRHNNTYEWLQKNISIRNADRLTPRLCELLCISIPVKDKIES